MTDPDVFWSMYGAFSMALDFLARSPEEQAELMETYNVALELNIGIQAGPALMMEGPEMFSPEQSNAIVAIGVAVDSIPSEAWAAAAGAEARIDAMRREAWTSVRASAASLMLALAPLNEQCEAFFA